MDRERLTALRFAADALTSRPDANKAILDYLEEMWTGDDELLSATASVREALNDSTSADPRLKLWEASERLLAHQDSSLAQNAGAALYSAILDRGWRMQREQIRDALSGTKTTRLLERYRRAFDEGRSKADE